MNSKLLEEQKKFYQCTSIIGLSEYHFKTSEDKDSVHVVDLTDREGYGSCTCQQWDFRIRPKIGTEIDPKSEEYMCKHIRRARHLASIVIALYCMDGATNNDR